MDAKHIPLIILALLIAVGAFFIIKARKKKAYYKTSRDIDIPAPANPRTDLLFGYYTTDRNQVEEVKNHASVHWQNFWEGEDKAIQDMRHAAAEGMAIVLDLSPYIFEAGGKAILKDAQSRVDSFFALMRANGVLSDVAVFTPIDEPNLPQTQADGLIPAAVAIINNSRAKFPECEGSKLGLIYYYEPPFRNIELFDIVGFDNYHSKSLIFAPGQQYESFKKLLQPHQKTWIIPGGSYNQDPEPFVNFALANHEVWAVIAFLWADLPHDGIGHAIRINDAVKPLYIEQGLRIKALNRAAIAQEGWK